MAQVKQKCGIIERENCNKPKYEDTKSLQCPLNKEKAIKEALKILGMKIFFQGRYVKCQNKLFRMDYILYL